MILDEIINKTKQDLEIRKKIITFEKLEKEISNNTYKIIDVKNVLKSTKNDPIKIIAEVKKSSPSKGIIRNDFDALQIALEYSKNGADCISVLTEPHYFHGKLEYLKKIKENLNTPLLRKDFIFDKYQIAEALINGADFILLIAKALGSKELKNLYEYAISLNLEVLVEIHDENDLNKAIECNPSIIGINHRNLETFEMNMNLCEELISKIPNGKIIIAESGVSNIETIKKLNNIGIDGFLIGEYFMKSSSIKEELNKFKNALNH